jgi:hypothetical protein
LAVSAAIAVAFGEYTWSIREGELSLSTDVEEIYRALTLDAQGRLAEDLPCRACGYNLRGHARDALCPECSTPVSLSARSDLLRFSDPDWIERLAKGMRLIVIGLIASAVLQAAVAAISVALTTVGTTVFTALMATAGLLGAGFSVIVVVGVWWLTTPDPARVERERALSIRRLTRWCLAAQIAAVPLQVASPTGGVGVLGSGAPLGAAFIALTTAEIALWLVVLVGYAAGFVYLRRLALRAPKPSVARQTKIVMWGYLSTQGLAVLVAVLFLVVFGPALAAGAGPQGALVVIGIGGCVVTLASLIFAVWALVLLFRYGATLRQAAREARAAWAASTQISA